MAKTNQSRAQEALLIVYVAACCVLVALTLLIAFDESDAGATTRDAAYGYPSVSESQIAPTPSARPASATPPPTLDPRTKQPTLTF